MAETQPGGRYLIGGTLVAADGTPVAEPEKPKARTKRDETPPDPPAADPSKD